MAVVGNGVAGNQRRQKERKMLIPARFPGRCGSCGGSIEVGEQISWTKGVRVVFHAGCSAEGREAAKAAQASRAVDADVELACPEGLAYMPFQRAGIAFALARLRCGPYGARKAHANRSVSAQPGTDGSGKGKFEKGALGSGQKESDSDTKGLGKGSRVSQKSEQCHQGKDDGPGDSSAAFDGTGCGQGQSRGEFPRRERPSGDTVGSVCGRSVGAIGLREGTRGSHERTEDRPQATKRLQGGLRESGNNGSDRAGRTVASNRETSSAGQEKDRGSRVDGVASNSDSAQITGVLFGDEPGLGKTIQVIGVINNAPEIESVLVICPKSLTINWTRELRRWLCRDLSVGTHPVQKTEILVISYEDAKKYKEQISRPWGLIVADEAHYLKNARSQRSKCCRELFGYSSRRATLTGTPIPNRPIELWPLLQMTDPNGWDPEGKGFWRFASRYAGAVKDSYGWDMTGATNLPELQQKLRSTCMVRRLKKDVLTELPAKRRQVVELPATGAAGAIRAEREAWDRVEVRLQEARVRVELARASEDPEEFAAAVKSLNKATVVAFDEISKQRHATAVAKIPHVLEHARLALEDDTDAKIIIFGHHHDVLDSIRSGLAEFGVVGIDGRNSSEERQAAVDRFQTDKSIRVFVGGIHAAGVGLTLTASAHVLFAELDWVPGNMCQAEDRAHRIGQDESVLVQFLVLEGSIDARMAAVLVEKMAIADQGLDLEVKREPAIPTAGIPATMGSVSELQKVALTLSAANVAEIHAALRRLAACCDGAASVDGQGFSKIDVQIGKSLAANRSLSPKQAALGMRLCRKYRRQLGEGCWTAKEGSK